MKLILKTTALAIFVALSATACLSNSSHSDSNPKAVNPRQDSNTGNSGDGSNTGNLPGDNHTANGVEWRVLDMGRSSSTLGQLGEIDRMDMLNDGNGKLNFNELSSNSLGKFEGRIDSNEYVMGDKPESKGIDYVFINQPYSTYGMVKGVDNGVIEPFAVMYTPGKEVLGSLNISDKKIVPGDATYNGEVIATAEVRDKEGNIDVIEPKVDGKVTLDMYVDPDSKALVTKGKIDSQLVGEIKLLPAEVSTNLGWINEIMGNRAKAFAKNGSGTYRARFGGEGYSEVIGDIGVGFGIGDDSPKVEDGKTISSYSAVFGAKKQ